MIVEVLKVQSDTTQAVAALKKVGDEAVKSFGLGAESAEKFEKKLQSLLNKTLTDQRGSAAAKKMTDDLVKGFGVTGDAAAKLDKQVQHALSGIVGGDKEAKIQSTIDALTKGLGGASPAASGLDSVMAQVGGGLGDTGEKASLLERNMANLEKGGVKLLENGLKNLVLGGIAVTVAALGAAAAALVAFGAKAVEAAFEHQKFRDSIDGTHSQLISAKEGVGEYSDQVLTNVGDMVIKFTGLETKLLDVEKGMQQLAEASDKLGKSEGLKRWFAQYVLSHMPGEMGEMMKVLDAVSKAKGGSGLLPTPEKPPVRLSDVSITGSTPDQIMQQRLTAAKDLNEKRLDLVRNGHIAESQMLEDAALRDIAFAYSTEKAQFDPAQQTRDRMQVFKQFYDAEIQGEKKIQAHKEATNQEEEKQTAARKASAEQEAQDKVKRAQAAADGEALAKKAGADLAESRQAYQIQEDQRNQTRQQRLISGFQNLAGASRNFFDMMQKGGATTGQVLQGLLSIAMSIAGLFLTPGGTGAGIVGIVGRLFGAREGGTMPAFAGGGTGRARRVGGMGIGDVSLGLFEPGEVILPKRAGSPGFVEEVAEAARHGGGGGGGGGMTVHATFNNLAPPNSSEVQRTFERGVVANLNDMQDSNRARIQNRRIIGRSFNRK